MAQQDNKKVHTTGTDRRNMWLLILTTLLVIGSVIVFTPPQERINQGLDIQGGLSVVLQANATDGSTITEEAMDASKSIIESRVNALGASEATVQRQGSNQILIQIPGLSDTQEALDAIGRTGNLEFARLDSFTDETVKSEIDSGAMYSQGYYTDSYGNQFPSGENTNYTVEPDIYTPIVTGANINTVNVDLENGIGPNYAVDITLDSEGTKAFSDASRDLVDEHGKIVIILDGVVNSAPAVQSVIDNGRVQITGNYTKAEADALRTVLESGSLPVSFSYAQSQTVGPTLGQDALKSGVLVAGIGLLLVMLYLLFFYRGLGMITAGGMAVFACLYLGILALLSRFGLFSLSLSGVAGIVLTIGMAADSSILTLERFREEIRFGRSVRAASITGVRHGIMTSIDADLVSLVTAIMLFIFGAAAVKGFGATLALGILCDILMMLVFKAPIIRLLAPRAIAKNPGFWGIKDCLTATEVYQHLADLEGETVETTASAEAINKDDNRALAIRKAGAEGAEACDAIDGIKGRFIKHDINFLKYRKIFLGLAGAAMLLSLGLIGIKGLNLGIEFQGGTSIDFTNTAEITLDEMRAAFNDAGEPDAVIQTTETNGVPGFLVRITQDDAAAAAGTAADVSDALGLSTDAYEVNTISPDWGPTIIRAMFLALLVSFFAIILYITARFRAFKMGVIAVIVLIHDILFVVGIYALFGRELNPNTIAALLTILGYSLYDTVVVFHRIVDNMQSSEIKCTFMTMANHSLNQVLIRSINTSVTSLIPVIFMLVFGSETLKDFAFAMVIGLIIGFYSSIAIAVPLYAIWKSREPAYKHLEAKYGTEVGRFEFEHGALRSGRSNVAPELADTSVSARAQSASDSADAGSAAQSSDSGTTMSGTQETRTGATAAAEASAVMTGAQAAKAARAKERKKQAAKMVEDAAQKKTVRTPEVRIVDQEKFDASTAPEPEVPKRGAGRYSDANRAAAELQREELEELRAGDASLEGEMASAAALAEAFEAEETAAERAERMRQIERAEQAARDKAKAAARREKRKRNANK
ncbi:MAG: protein translocase subunit SecD [Eggerthellaceae bacterium]|nr:protein translocase subunit SecD [Eggerthellaceae bacterium]